MSALPVAIARIKGVPWPFMASLGLAPSLISALTRPILLSPTAAYKADAPLLLCVPTRGPVASAADMVQLLIDHGADVNLAWPTQFEQRRRPGPMMMAVKKGDLKVIAMLLDAGADVNAVHPGGRTALIFAASQKNFKIVKYLVGRGADVNLSVLAGDGVLNSPLSAARSRDVKKLLITMGATNPTPRS